MRRRHAAVRLAELRRSRRALVRVAVVPRAVVARLSASRDVADLMRQHVLLHVALGREASVADVAPEWTLLGVAAVVNVQGALAGEGLVANLACGSCFVGTPERVSERKLRQDAWPEMLELEHPEAPGAHHLVSPAVFVLSFRESRRVRTAAWGGHPAVDGSVLQAVRRRPAIFGSLRRPVPVRESRRHLVLMAADDVRHLLERLARVVVAERARCVDGLDAVLEGLERRRVRRAVWEALNHRRLRVQREIWRLEGALVRPFGFSRRLGSLGRRGAPVTPRWCGSFLAVRRRRLTSLGRRQRRFSVELPVHVTVVVVDSVRVVSVVVLHVVLSVHTVFILLLPSLRRRLPQIQLPIGSQGLEPVRTRGQHGMRESHRVHGEREPGELHVERGGPCRRDDHVRREWHVLRELPGVHADVLLEHQRVRELLVANRTLQGQNEQKMTSNF